MQADILFWFVSVIFIFSQNNILLAATVNAECALFLIQDITHLYFPTLFKFKLILELKKTSV